MSASRRPPDACLGCPRVVTRPSVGSIETFDAASAVRTNEKSPTWGERGRRRIGDALPSCYSPRPDAARTLDEDHAASASGWTSKAEQPGATTDSKDRTPLPSYPAR